MKTPIALELPAFKTASLEDVLVQCFSIPINELRIRKKHFHVCISIKTVWKSYDQELLFGEMVIYDDDFETKENKNERKRKCYNAQPNNHCLLLLGSWVNW